MQCSLDRLIAPSFYKVHNSIEDYTHFWLCGGRGSTKSSFVSVEIILGIMKNADTNAVVLRKVGAYLKDSVFSQLEWAIEKLGVSDMWDIKASVPEMVYKKNRSENTVSRCGQGTEIEIHKGYARIYSIYLV